MDVFSMSNIGLSNTGNNANILAYNAKEDSKVNLSSINMTDFSTMQNLFKTNNFQSIGQNVFKEGQNVFKEAQNVFKENNY